jgi:hypothetical protein
MSIFNEPINPILTTQLGIRQNLLGKQNRNSFELTFLNSNTSWVKLQSSVNLNNSPQAAKDNILFGGLIARTPSSDQSGTAETIPAGLSTGQNYLNKGRSYNLQTSTSENNVLGLRPMPGITSVNIENIGAYGSTRKATINFQCWDVKQLEILEALYMRPGYTILLELGRVQYLNSTSDRLLQVSPKNNFFDEKIDDLFKYLSNLYRSSLNQGGHYDAFFGYVINFKWAINDGGGYNCMTEILSTGEVVESLKLNYSYGGAIKYDTLGTTVEDAENASFKGLFLNRNSKVVGKDVIRFNNEYAESILSGLIYELYTTFRYESNGGLYSKSTNPAGSSQIKILSPSGNPIPVDWARMNYESTADEPISTDDTADNTRFLFGKQNYYITLGSFCELVNAFIIPQAYGDDFSTSKGNLTGISTKGRTYTKKTNTSPEQLLCLYNSLLISTNPDVCWVNNSKWTNVISNTGVDVDTTPVAPIVYSNIYVKEPWSNDLRGRIQGWLNDMFDKNVDHEIIEQNIDNTYKTFKTRSSLIVDEKGFYKALQANFQIIRGGISNNKRNWDGFTAGTPRALNALQIPIASVSDNFWELYKYNYPSARLPLISRVENLLATYSGGSSVDTNLDREIQQFAAQVAVVQNAAKTADEASTNLTTIANNFKKLSFFKDFKYDKKNGGTSKSDFGVIENIYINLKHLYLLSKSQTSLSSDPSGKNIISLGRYFDSLIHDIQTSLGNVNDFKIHIDPIDGIARIIDLNYINKDQASGLFEFNIGTNDSIVRDLKLESYMSNDMMNMISISAQAEPGRMGYDNTTLTTYNSLITDRNLPTKDVPLRVSNDGTAAVNFISNLGMLVNTYLKKLFEPDGTVVKDANTEEISSTTTKPTYDANKSNTYSNSLREIINFLASNPNYTSDNAGKSLLATEISLTLDGLSGFVIGNLFKVDNTFIPKYYKNTYQEMGYTITGVSHELSANDWTTTIKAFPVDLGSNKVQPTNPKKFSTIYINSNIPGGGGGGTGDGDGSTPGVTNTDCGSATVDVLPLLKRNGIKYKTLESSMVTPQFYNDLEKFIIPFMLKYSKSLFVTSVNRIGDPGKHGNGNAIDFQIDGINAAALTATSWKNTDFSNWYDFRSTRLAKRTQKIDISKPNRSHPYNKDQINAIRELDNALIGAFSATPLASAYYYGFKLGGNSYRMLNENLTPTEKADGPHYHFQRQCGGTVDPTPKSTRKSTPKKKAQPENATATSTPVGASSTTPPGATPLIPTITTTPIPPQPSSLPQNLTTALQSAITNPPTESPIIVSVSTPSPTPPTPSLTPPAPSQPPKPAVTPPVPSPTIMAAPPKKSTIKFPRYVQVVYTADGSRTNIVDEMHSFDSTSKLQPNGTRKIYIVGNGNQLVMDELKKLYDLGFKPIVTEVKLVATHFEKSVSMKWSVEINESTDGLAYTGFTSRGSARTDRPVNTSDIFEDPEKTETGVKNAVQKKFGYTPVKVKLVANVTDDESNYKYLNQGTRHIRQVFYSYTDKNPEGIKSE